MTRKLTEQQTLHRRGLLTSSGLEYTSSLCANTLLTHGFVQELTTLNSALQLKVL